MSNHPNPSEWLRTLEESAGVARVGRDPEGVHKVRVASGRLDTRLRLCGMRVLRDDLRWLRRRAADVRDLDVVIASSPPARWLPWLRRRRAGARRELLAALDDTRFPALLRALSLLPPFDAEGAAKAAQRLEARALRRGEEVEADPHDVERLHGLRRALRRVRYAREWLGRDAEPLKRLQDALGEVNDAAVTLRLLEQYRDSDALVEYRAAVEGRLCAARARALEAWTAHRAQWAAATA